MSSAIYLNYKRNPVKLGKWNKFCKNAKIRYSPNTIGRNIYYYNDAEISFGEYVFDDLPKDENDNLRFDLAKPNNVAKEIKVSTYFMGNLENVSNITKKIMKKFKPSSFSNDPEYKELLK